MTVLNNWIVFGDGGDSIDFRLTAENAFVKLVCIGLGNKHTKNVISVYQ